MIRQLALAFLLPCLLAVAVPAHAARLALVVGISDYEVQALQTGGRTARDATEVSRVLTDVAGYDKVVLVPPNADRRTFSEKLAELRGEVAPGDFVLFFFSGHGIEKFDDNWLLLSTVPDEFSTTPEVLRDELAQSSISLKQLVADLKATGAGQVVLVINACRSEGPPTLGDGDFDLGMAHIKEIPQSTAVLYAASSGREALICLTRDCVGEGDLTVFTRHFVEALATPNLPIQQFYETVGSAVEEAAASVKFEQTAAIYLDGIKFGDRGKLLLGPVRPLDTAQPPDNEQPPDDEQQASLPDPPLPDDEDTITALGTFGSWTAWKSTETGEVVCYISAAPLFSYPVAERNPIHFMIIHRTKEGTRNEVQNLMGYTVDPDDGYPTATVDGRAYPMVTSGEAAWLASEADQDGFVEALKGGFDLVVEAALGDEVTLTDSYDLSGISAALSEIDQACG